MAEQLRRTLIRWLGGVIREPVEVVPPSLISALRLVDGLMSQKQYDKAQGQLRVLLIKEARPDAR